MAGSLPARPDRRDLPIIYAQTDEAIEEERRLLYVGVTRARERLYLSWALARDRRRAPDPQAIQVPGRTRARPRRSGTASRCEEWRRVAAAGSRDAAGRPNADDPLFRQLREWRLATSKEQAVPAYVVFSDATLQAIADTRPVTRAQLASVPGVGAVKLDRYGAAVLALCADSRQRRLPKQRRARRAGQPAGTGARTAP